MKSVLVSGYDLADIHGVVVVIAVPLVLHFLSHVVRCDVGHTALAADEYQLGLLEGRLTLYEYRGKTLSCILSMSRPDLEPRVFSA